MIVAIVVLSCLLAIGWVFVMDRIAKLKTLSYWPEAALAVGFFIGLPVLAWVILIARDVLDGP